MQNLLEQKSKFDSSFYFESAQYFFCLCVLSVCLFLSINMRRVCVCFFIADFGVKILIKFLIKEEGFVSVFSFAKKVFLKSGQFNEKITQIFGHVSSIR